MFKSSPKLGAEPFVPERLLFCIDLHKDMGLCDWDTNSGNTRLLHVAAAVRALLYVKATLSKAHEYALAVLMDGAVLLVDWRTDVTDVLDQVFSVAAHHEGNSFDANSIFTIVKEAMATPSGKNFIYRVIWVHGRAEAVPSFDAQEFSSVLQAPNFVLDVVLVQGTKGKYASFWEAVSAMQGPKSYSYVATTALELSSSMNQLLAHGAQRPIQKEFKTSYD